MSRRTEYPDSLFARHKVVFDCVFIAAVCVFDPIKRLFNFAFLVAVGLEKRFSYNLGLEKRFSCSGT